ncbi:hypothetical protein H0H87_011062 [Tephrocybe sp. NHM501043]|nr:hypothetical protein H0H87_011062 [Tephrocybe sp. NHM501043]
MPNVGFSSASLTLSEDRTIESVLTDIPFFCVGLMTFGIFTFVLVLKRVNIIVLYLYASSFLAFAAAIFDLGHILTEPRAVVVDGVVRDAPSGLVTAREVGLALSVGFLYIFLWHLVAQRPHAEPASEYNDPFGVDRSPISHSASWRQWGLLGMALQWSLLGLSVTLSALQVVWRISSLDARSTTIYITEAIIQIVVSALFILKILLNIFVSPVTPWWRSVQSNVAPLLALCISAGLGVGNLLAPLFSETILGRFFRAVEMYILILFVLITTFHKSSVAPAEPLSRCLDIEEGRSSMRLSSEKPVDPIDTTLHFTPHRPPRISGWGTNNTNSPSTGQGRPSTVTWVIPGIGQRNSTWSDLSDERELGPFAAATPASSNAPTPKPSASPKHAIKTELTTTPDEIRSNSGEELVASVDKHLTSVSALSISSYYGMDQRASYETLPPPPPPALPRETGSPVYGLNGILAQSRTQPTHQQQRSSISFNELLRQQTELDKSIAALRLYTADASSSVLDTTSQQPTGRYSGSHTPKMPNIRASGSINSYLGRKPESASNRSEFSLSNFPQPPGVEVDGLPNSVKLEKLIGRARALRLEPIVPQGVEIKVDDSPSLPVSPNQFEGTSRMESAGTQYDVTSFIGGLTLPGRSSALTTGSIIAPASGLATANSPLSAVESEDESSPSETDPAIRPMILATTKIVASSGTVSSKDRPRPVLLPRRAPTPLRPLLLGTTSADDVNVAALGSSSRIPIGSRRRLRGEISVPSLPQGDVEDAPGAFERPRTPPLLSK